MTSRIAVLAPLAIGVAGAIATVVYGTVDPARAALAWTAAYGFGLATALAAIGLVFALHLAHAKWWLVVRRPLVACASTAPLFVPLFAPIALLLDRVYPWASGARIASLEPEVQEVLAHQRAWNTTPAFLLRAALYLAVFSALSIGLRRLHARYDDGAGEAALASARRLAAAGTPLLAFAMTFAVFDWLMSAEAGFSSDMLGVYVLASGLVAAVAVFALGAIEVPEAQPDHLHAIGRLLFMSVVFWAYIGFFQLLLVWIADLPREVGFYRARSLGGWAFVDAALVGGRFAIPFLLLLSRPLKRSRRALGLVAGWLLATTALEHAWFVLPSARVELSPWDLGPFACVGGLAWAYGAHLLARAPAAAAPPASSLALSLRYESR